ncbi:uncharacterized protein [Onthophagus taurus]|uniref:uncharacterized protein n=1 Tax=Onthophagus taurus TaxID=166361 RepID=UPI000C1FFBC4|nr:uncharacterized protein LOC111425077 [Onthophagus taurus]
MDALLMFDVLMYLNFFYYPMAAFYHPIIILAKFYSPSDDDTTRNDIIVVTAMIFTDLIKLGVYKKIRENRKVIAVIITILLSSITFCCTLHIVIVQKNPTKMERIFSSMTATLYFLELMFGILQFFPCCQKTEYN